MQITRYGDIGTPELLKRKGIKITLFEGQPRARVNKVSPIDTMYERSILTLAQFSAAKKLYNCWVLGWGERGSYEIREKVSGGGKDREITTSQLHAMREYKRGRSAANTLWEVVNQVVINEIPATHKTMGGYRKKQIIYQLKRALDDIARVYGFKA